MDDFQIERPRTGILYFALSIFIVWGAFQYKKSIDQKRLMAELAIVNQDIPRYEAVLAQAEKMPPKEARILRSARPHYEDALKRKRELEAKLKIKNGR